MKKTVSILLFALLLFGLGACKSGGEGETPPEESPPASVSPEASAAGETEETSPPLRTDLLNPLTGQNTLAEDAAGKPCAAVLISNYRYAWPQSGVGAADIVIEMESEARETGFLCLYADVRNAPAAGPLLPLFGQFAQVAQYLSPVMLHLGYPLDDISVIPETSQLLDGASLPDIVTLDEARRSGEGRSYLEEYCYFADGGKLFDRIAASGGAGSDAAAFQFSDASEPRIPSGGEAAHLWGLFTSFYDCDLRYDAESGRYMKWEFLQQQTDAGDGSRQLGFENALVLFGDMRYSPNSFNADRMMDVDYAAGGTGYYLYGGRYEEIAWKQQPGAPFELTGADGQPLAVNPGKTYIAVLDNISKTNLAIS